MLIITAPGRCGSSLIAKYCKHLGHNPGGVWDIQSNSGYEDGPTRKINELHYSRKDVPDKIKEVESQRKVIKDCNFFRKQDAVERWHKHASEIRFLALWRNPLDQYESWKAFPGRNKPMYFTAEWFIVWAKERKREFSAACRSRGILVRWMYYPRFLGQPKKLIDNLHWGGLEFDDDIAMRIWKSIIRRRLVHYDISKALPKHFQIN